MFDAWIANQDRHDENWGVLRTNEGNVFLSPSFDHGSSMARNESDCQRKERLETRDLGRHISNFVCKAKSGFFAPSSSGKAKSMLTIDAFSEAAQYSPLAAAEWMERLRKIEPFQIDDIIDKIPLEWMTPVSRNFTGELLRLNRERILKVKI